RILLGALLALSLRGEMMLKASGKPTAPIAIEIYSDFECPACKQLHETTMRQVVESYVNTGKVYLVHREFPLPMHKYSRIAPPYVCVANRIAKDGVVADALFRQQESWSKTGNVDAEVSSVLSPAEAAKVRTLAKDPQIEAVVEEDIALGKKV